MMRGDLLVIRTRIPLLPRIKLSLRANADLKRPLRPIKSPNQAALRHRLAAPSLPTYTRLALPADGSGCGRPGMKRPRASCARAKPAGVCPPTFHPLTAIQIKRPQQTTGGTALRSMSCAARCCAWAPNRDDHLQPEVFSPAARQPPPCPPFADPLLDETSWPQSSSGRGSCISVCRCDPARKSSGRSMEAFRPAEEEQPAVTRP